MSALGEELGHVLQVLVEAPGDVVGPVEIVGAGAAPASSSGSALSTVLQVQPESAASRRPRPGRLGEDRFQVHRRAVVSMVSVVTCLVPAVPRFGHWTTRSEK